MLSPKKKVANVPIPMVAVVDNSNDDEELQTPTQKKKRKMKKSAATKSSQKRSQAQIKRGSLIAPSPSIQTGNNLVVNDPPPSTSAVGQLKSGSSDAYTVGFCVY
uniref:Uncharacterized protein n=1 Tax=Panagrolaimus sp. ES5 TaxID=591445 RepID=A0AC34G9T3_9BILA